MGRLMGTVNECYIREIKSGDRTVIKVKSYFLFDGDVKQLITVTYAGTIKLETGDG